MARGPRCGQLVEYYELTRSRDAMDVVRREPGEPDPETHLTYTPCFRPQGHPGHCLSEPAVRRMEFQSSARRSERRRRRREAA